MQKTKANHNSTINLSIFLKRSSFSFDVIRSIFLILHSINLIQSQSSCQTIRFIQIHMKSCHRHRILSIHHRNRITIVIIKFEDINIAFESSNAFKTRLKKIVNAICFIIQK